MTEKQIERLIHSLESIARSLEEKRKRESFKERAKSWVK